MVSRRPNRLDGVSPYHSGITSLSETRARTLLRKATAGRLFNSELRKDSRAEKSEAFTSKRRTVNGEMSFLRILRRQLFCDFGFKSIHPGIEKFAQTAR